MKPLPIYTADLETDPFLHGRLPKPFASALYDGKEFHSFWRPKHSNQCVIKSLVELTERLEPGYIFIHNGGRFDIFYLLDYLGENTFILNNRIVKAALGDHEVRDSYAIMPFPLKKYKKDDIDYAKFEMDVRDENREEILKYLKGDCVYLHELCSRFVERFGPRLTIGGTSLNELKKYHQYKTLSASEDKEIRSTFYYGGRVQCFEKGIIHGNLKVYDVNSMYPFAMKNFQHPTGRPTSVRREITPETFFLTVTGKNYGAFPQRTKEGIRFDIDKGTFTISIHEWRTAIMHDLFKPSRIEKTINFDDSNTFARFVDEYYHEREQAKLSGDDITSLFTKYVLNSAYGKFAQNPANCFNYCIRKPEVTMTGGWKPAWISEGRYVIWKKFNELGDKLRVNVATAASITGASRAVLLDAIARSSRPVYCDTDSLICDSLSGVDLEATRLGAWKLEKTGDKVAIAGRKLYAVFNKGECVKMASKGVKLTAEEIERAAKGETITYRNMVPSFKWDGSHNFITRRVKLT